MENVMCEVLQNAEGNLVISEQLCQIEAKKWLE